MRSACAVLLLFAACSKRGLPELEAYPSILATDPTIAADPRVKSCLAGTASACAEAASALGGGTITGKEEPEARTAAYAVGCRNGDPNLCGEVANALARGYGAAKDIATAMRIFQQACDANDGVSCSLLASIYKRGDEGVAPDKDKARALLEKGCALHDKTACASLAPRHRHSIPEH